jgi:hypothetical protein
MLDASEIVRVELEGTDAGSLRSKKRMPGLVAFFLHSVNIQTSSAIRIGPMKQKGRGHREASLVTRLFDRPLVLPYLCSMLHIPGFLKRFHLS